MAIALTDIILFVTAFVSFVYGTRIAWACGKNCNSRKNSDERIEKMKEYLPISTLIYFFGLIITSKYLYKFLLRNEPTDAGTVSIIFMSLINALLLSSAVGWLAIPKRRRLF
jgi:hypothetical protein